MIAFKMIFNANRRPSRKRTAQRWGSKNANEIVFLFFVFKYVFDFQPMRSEGPNGLKVKHVGRRSHITYCGELRYEIHVLYLLQIRYSWNYKIMKMYHLQYLK